MPALSTIGIAKPTRKGSRARRYLSNLEPLNLMGTWNFLKAAVVLSMVLDCVRVTWCGNNRQELGDETFIEELDEKRIVGKMYGEDAVYELACTQGVRSVGNVQ